MPDLTFVVESDTLGDIGCVSLTAAELVEAKSAPRSEQGEIPRNHCVIIESEFEFV